MIALFMLAMGCSALALVVCVMYSNGVFGKPGEGTTITTGGSGWKKANATYYWSYPQCCKNSPSYDPNADTTECDENSGCEYLGKFAGVDGTKSYEWVKSNNITSFFLLGGGWEKWSGKDIMIRNPKTGKTMTVKVVDTCGDGDCKGCCTRNATKGGGALVDLEYWTAKRFWGDDLPGEAAIEWKDA